MTTAIERIVDEQANRDPSLLERDRSKAAALVEGTISRGSEPFHKSVAKYIDSHTVDSDELTEKVEAMVRELIDELKEQKK